MKPSVLILDYPRLQSGGFLLTKEEIEELIEKSYNSGYNDGYVQGIYATHQTEMFNHKIPTNDFECTTKKQELNFGDGRKGY